MLQGYQVLSRKMSNSVGHNLMQQHFLRPTVLEHQSKLKNSSGVPTNSFFATASLNQSPAQTRKHQICTKFYGNSLNKRKQKLVMGSQRAVTFLPQAVLAADPAFEVIFSILVASFLLSCFWILDLCKAIMVVNLLKNGYINEIILPYFLSLISILRICWQEWVVNFV